MTEVGEIGAGRRNNRVDEKVGGKMVEGELGRGFLFICLFLLLLLLLLLSFVCLFLRGVNKCDTVLFVFKLSQFQSMVYIRRSEEPYVSITSVWFS